MDRLAHVVATVGGLGHAPVAPGTIASLLPVLVVWWLAPSDAWLVVAAAVITATGIWAAGRDARRLRVHDPSHVVVDEVAGMLIAVVAQPRTAGWLLTLFLLFRVMDVWKPPPIRQLEAWPGGWGIVADDVLAGVFANGIGQLGGVLARSLSA